MSDTDDEDLRKAIALSLQQSSPPRKTEPDVVIDLVSSEDEEEEDDDLDAPVVARLSQNASKPVPSQNEAVQGIPITASTSQHHGCDTIDYAASSPAFKHPAAAANSVSMPKSQPIVTSLQNMDRARMEAERLQRLARMKQMQGQEGNSSRKRKEPDTSSSPLGSGRQGQAKKVSTASTKDHLATFTSPESESQSKVTPQARPLTLRSDSTDRAVSVISYQDQQRLGAPGIQFPYGTVKKTWVYGCPRTGDDIKIEEVLQKDDLELAVLSAFQVDSDWIITKLKPTTKVIWVLQAKGEAQKENFRSGAPANYRFCFPNMEGIVNCMHSKLQLLAHPSYLRIVVPSANLTSYDWGETGQMENVLFLIDLPRLPKSQESHNELTGFGKELIHFLQAMGLKEHTINSIKCFDFKNTEKLAFVHTIGGSHSGSDLFRTGFCGLGNSVRSLGLSTEAALKIDFLAASVGSLNDSFLQSLYLAAQGDNGLKEYKWRTDKGSKNKNKNETKDSEPSALLQIEDELKTNVKIYFPTRQTVENSRGGRAAGGTICFQRKWYDSATFATARSLMVDCKSQREGILSHSKMIFTRPQEGTTRPWIYVGSANLSQAAWGRLVKNKKGELALNCRNWECGVVLAVQEVTDNEHGPPKRVDMDMDVFQGHVPVPMAFPGEAYRVEYGEEPWFYSEHL